MLLLFLVLLVLEWFPVLLVLQVLLMLEELRVMEICMLDPVGGAAA